MEALTWFPYESAEKMPIHEPILMETDSNNYRFQIGIFRKSANGHVVGVVGGHFHYDIKCTRWARIAHLLPKE